MYEILVVPRAGRDLDALPSDRFRAVNAAILGLERDPRGHQTVKLTGNEGYRLRVGDYRVLYRIDDEERTVTVTAIEHRGDAYRSR